MSRLGWILCGVIALPVSMLLMGERAVSSAPGAARDAGAPTVVTRDAGAAEGTCPSGMSYLPATTFTVGSNDKKNKKYWLELEDGFDWPWLDEPIRKVAINALCMDTTKVTVAAYQACAKTGKCATIPEKACRDRFPRVDDHPMRCVTWEQADQFCRAVGKRLPTEEEWEYGARGPKRLRYPWGNSDPHWAPHSSGLVEACQVLDADSPCSVNQFKKFASPFGLLDMAGNLAEWTSSDYCEPEARCGKIVRGSGQPSPGDLRGAHRESHSPEFGSTSIGFRCAISVGEPAN